MTDAEKAFQIAEQRIERARTEDLPYLCLAESPDSSDPVKWDKEEALQHLATIPPSISSLPELKRLDLDGTQVTDLSPLAGMVAMQTLYLDSTQVTDLSPLAGMVAMQKLWLNSTQVTDLSPLAGMVAMQKLWLRNTQAEMASLVAPAQRGNMTIVISGKSVLKKFRLTMRRWLRLGGAAIDLPAAKPCPAFANYGICSPRLLLNANRPQLMLLLFCPTRAPTAPPPFV